MSEPVEPNFNHDDREGERLHAIIAKAIEDLGPEFDSIIILATHGTETGGTATFSNWRGNWHAQNGMMQHTLNKRKTMTDEEVRQDMREAD